MAFLVAGEKTVFIDPFGPVSSEAAARGLEFGYPPIEGVAVDLVLVTHEHFDHNGVEAVGGSPVVIRATAGRIESPVGEVVAIASEHDDVAGTARGPNTIFRFSLDGLRLCHLGDFGQSALRPEQRDAIGEVDVLFLPVGGAATIDGLAAAEVVRTLRPRLVVAMHYRTTAINFLEPPQAFLDAAGARIHEHASSEVDVEDVMGAHDEPTVVLLAPPLH